jgi:hypothetical protein
MSDTESNSNTNSNSSSSNSNKAPKQNAQTKKEKRKVTITDKVRGLFTEREKVRANLTAKLGKGARVANAAAFYKKYPKAENRAEHINTFVTSLRERNAKKAANKPAPKPKSAKTKKNSSIAPAPAPAPVEAPKKTKTAKRGRPKLPNAYKKNTSIEKEAEKVIKKVEAIQKELAKVNLKMEDICEVCKDLRPNTPPKA